jgi:alcohol dehydrogenase (cytochrome c)
VLFLLWGAGATSGSERRSAVPRTPPTISQTWSLPGADLGNDRDAGGPINASNVANLGVAWTHRLPGSPASDAYATTPVFANGVMYTQNLDSNVQAIDVASGALLWARNYNLPSNGPNGVSIVNGTVYGATDNAAFALRASNGKQLWIKKLTATAQEAIDMAPGYDDGTLYISTVVPANHSDASIGHNQAVLWALNARTGATKWKWDEVPSTLWSTRHGTLNSGGGQWNPPSFDSHGDIYVGVANPGPWPGTPAYPFGSSRPGPDLYTDSIVKLDPSNGKPIWHYQLTPHDIYDWDLQNSPILATVRGRQIVIDGGKAGILIAVDARTGKLLWQRPVGVHDGHTNDGLLTEYGPSAKVHLPETVEPGQLGGIESELASNGTTVYAAVNNQAEVITGQGAGGVRIPGGSDHGTGDLVAVDEATGKVEWDVNLPASPYGAATLVNDVVFTTTINGTLYAFDARTGKRLWQTALSAGTIAPIGISGDTLIAAPTLALAASERPQLVAFRLRLTGKLRPTARPGS